MNTAKPPLLGVKRSAKPHRMPSPVIALVTPEGRHVGYYNRRTGLLYTRAGTPSQSANDGRFNKAHAERWRIAHDRGFTVQGFSEYANRRDRRRQLFWVRRHQPALPMVHEGRTTRHRLPGEDLLNRLPDQEILTPETSRLDLGVE